MNKRIWFFIVVALGMTVTIGGTAYAVFYGLYLEAVAVSCIVPVLTWFATGAGKLGK